MSAIFERLIGLETEYAVRFRPRSAGAGHSDYELYNLLAARLASKLPTAAPTAWYGGKAGLFLATGGAVWFERTRFTSQVGLIEGSTPECRSPRHCLISQRAQDRLFSETARHAADDGEFCLIKNCRDSRGETYGAQENYEVILARGWRLAAWRVAWFVLLPVVALYIAVVFTLLVVLMLAILFVNLVLAGLIYWLMVGILRPDKARRHAWLSGLLGRAWVTDHEGDASWPAWVEDWLHRLIKLLTMPLLLLLYGLTALTEMRQTQVRLLAFLASRALLGGSGWLDARGSFHLTEKAQTRRVIWFDLVADSSRPVFNLTHYLKLLIPFSPRLREMLAGRQRMQISLGDSNLCEEAEYLRVATTALVLDAIEAGAIPRPPRLRQPLAAIRRISGDPTLTATVALHDGRRLTSIALQRWYLQACRRFVDRTPAAPAEARAVLGRWQDVLDRLESDRLSLVGRLDWVTKQYLLDQAGQGLPWASRKKIDLRYHELSPAGYFSMLRAAGRTAALLTDTEVDEAMRLPPSSSPALARARYIREFSGQSTLLRVGWRFLDVIDPAGKKTVIDLHE